MREGATPAGPWTRSANPHGSAPPAWRLGAEIQTALQEHTMHRTTPGNLARLTLYRTLRRFAGPALAFRLAFAGRAGA